MVRGSFASSRNSPGPSGLSGFYLRQDSGRAKRLEVDGVPWDGWDRGTTGRPSFATEPYVGDRAHEAVANLPTLRDYALVGANARLIELSRAKSGTLALEALGRSLLSNKPKRNQPIPGSSSGRLVRDVRPVMRRRQEPLSAIAQSVSPPSAGREPKRRRPLGRQSGSDRQKRRCGRCAWSNLPPGSDPPDIHSASRAAERGM